MWIKRDLQTILEKGKELPVKVLRGPRQVGKTSLLDHLGTHKLIVFDDLGIRSLAQSNPHLFFEQFKGPLILDEATLSPEIFPEIKKRVDEMRRSFQKNGKGITIDIWITGSNQTLLQKAVRESLAGRASYYLLNTLSIHELKQAFEDISIEEMFMKGGWPELYANPNVNPQSYLNDFIATFIEKDIVIAAGIEKKGAFSRALQLLSGRVGQLLSAADIAKNIGVDTTTLQSWVSIFEQNGILRTLHPFSTNLNQRLIKSPKVYFEDIGLAVRLQGWSSYEPIILSPYFELLFENLVLSEIVRVFLNKGVEPKLYFVRSKDQVEVDFLLEMPNQKFLAIESKVTPVDFTKKQIALLDSLQIEIVERWVVSAISGPDFNSARLICFEEIFNRLESYA